MTFTEPPDWHQHAACAGTDPDLFFPGRGQPITTEPVAEVAELAFMTARDDYPKLDFATRGPHHQGGTSREAQQALDEIDHLRRIVKDRDDWNDHLAIENSRLMLELAALRGDADVHAFHVQSGSNLCICGFPEDDVSHAEAVTP